MTTRQIWEIDDYNRIIDGTTKVLLFTVDTSSDDDLLPIMRKIAAAPAMYEALKDLLQQVEARLDVRGIHDLSIVAIKAKAALAQAEGR
jgi:predicted component of type VI protein secretion system